MHETRKLFDTDHFIVSKIREVVQMLLTDAFADAKYYWLTNISTITPDFDKKTHS